LLAKGRLEEGSQILETLARVNKNELPPSFKIKLEVLTFQDGGCRVTVKVENCLNIIQYLYIILVHLQYGRQQFRSKMYTAILCGN